jgi:hypothetical protein
MNVRQLLISALMIQTTCYSVLGGDEKDEAEALLRVSIAAKRTKLLRCEPLQVELLLENTGPRESAPVQSISAFLLGAKLHIQPEQGRPIAWRPPNMPGASFLPSMIKLRPGEIRRTPLEIAWSQRNPVFEQLGKHTIRLQWTGSERPLEATLDIEVVAGSQQDRECLKQILAHKLQGYLGRDGYLVFAGDAYRNARPDWKDAAEKICAVVRKFPESRYAIYCLCSIMQIIDAEERFEWLQQIPEDVRDNVKGLAYLRVRNKPDPKTLYRYARRLKDVDLDLARN